MINGSIGLNKSPMLGGVSTVAIGYTAAKKAIQENIDKANRVWQKTISPLTLTTASQLQGNIATSLIKSFSCTPRSFEGRKELWQQMRLKIREANTQKVFFEMRVPQDYVPSAIYKKYLAGEAESEKAPVLPELDEQEKPKKSTRRRVKPPKSSVSEETHKLKLGSKTFIRGELISNGAESERVPMLEADITESKKSKIEKRVKSPTPRVTKRKFVSQRKKNELQGPEHERLPEMPELF